MTIEWFPRNLAFIIQDVFHFAQKISQLYEGWLEMQSYRQPGNIFCHDSTLD